MTITAFAGAARRLDDIDIPRIGHRLDLEEDLIHAVLDVEAPGSGFDAQGRPRMLFEPHIFWRLLGPGAARDEAVRQGLAYPKWGTRPYPKDSYPRLLAAQRISSSAALRSASWGRGQILGDNAISAGFASVEDMVAAMMEDEEHHVEAMVGFIAAKGIDDELRARDWAGFARVYNGAGYRANAYHTRLAKAYAWWQTKPDTPWTPDLDTPEQVLDRVIALLEQAPPPPAETVVARIRDLVGAE
ncbi:N-acetylmuramidase family protein [Rubellimicrobium aerolatum]|uniref:N-acetylmuramidase family protein n=1 Tax=Rubellimicrobium aerolatum TaxID=490979 RepID=A0ABW0SFP5_9RHOB|nr:N-acetylmuramidase family protein [Rubellimicrobium aerolatum]MBP1806452.1 hypothetical protein [Rubellimicrobium aerolatum]